MNLLKALNIPTDNLYRFMALFGLLTTIFCFSFIPILTDKHNQNIFERNKIFSELAADLSYNEAKIQDLERHIPDSISIQRLKYSLTTPSDTILSSSDFKYYTFPIIDKSRDTIFNRIINELNVLNRETARKQYKFNVYERRGEDLENSLSFFRIYLVIIGITSSLLCVFGMFLWYVKYQKLLDLKLKKELV